MNSDIAAYKDLFVQTANNYIHQMQDALHQLASQPTDRQAVEHIHIAAHSLKSQNLAMGFESNGRLFLGIEKLFATLLETQKEVSPQLQHDLASWIDAFQTSLKDIDQTGKEKDLSSLQNQVSKYAV